MHKNRSLHTYVHRTLLFRLIVAALVLSFVIGLAVLFLERDRVSREVVDIAVNRISIFADRYDYLLTSPDILDKDKIHQAIVEFSATRNPDKSGSYAYVGIYEMDGTIITEFNDEKHEIFGAIKKQLQDENLKLSDQASDQYEIIQIAGQPIVSITLPLINNHRQPVGIIRAYFAFSETTINAFRSSGLWAMIGAIIIVLLTTAVLYPVILMLTRRITRYSMQLLDANLDTLETLGSAIAKRDSDTNAHNYRVTIYSVRIGEEVGLSDKSMRSLIKGSFLHDVGKIGIPDEILLKPGKLNEEEFEIMKTHVTHGHEIIQRSTWLQDAQEVVLYHHEKLAGKGYPEGLNEEGIPITARIFAIADVFDALTSKRPYKEAWPYEKAIAILEEGKGAHFDPLLLDAFIRIARPLYARIGGKEENLRGELGEIIRQYFHEDMELLE